MTESWQIAAQRGKRRSEERLRASKTHKYHILGSFSKAAWYGGKNTVAQDIRGPVPVRFISHYLCSSVVLVAQLCPTLCYPTSCRLPGSSVHGILQARVLEWIANPFSIFLTQESNLVLLHCRQILYHLSYREDPVTVWPWVSPSPMRFSLLFSKMRTLG